MPPGASRFLANRLRDLAWGCGFGALLTPPVVYSLALDEISVSSRLGQPLQALIPVSAAAGEVLDSACFSVAAAGDAGLPGIESVHLRLNRVTGQLTLRTAEPVREPLSEVTIRVRCDGTPALDRTFLVVLDPPDMLAESVLARASATPAETENADERAGFAPAADVSAAPVRAVGLPRQDAVAQSRAVGMPPRRAPRPASIAPAVAITPGSEYRIQIGDTLSSVAARVSGRPVGSVWAVAQRIQAQNPMAFLGGDPDRLVAGVEIAIPELDGNLAAPFARGHGPQAGTIAHRHAASAAREGDGVHSLRRFFLSTALSHESMERLQARRLGLIQATQAVANARLASIVGTPLGRKPEEPVSVRAEEPVAVETNLGYDEIEPVESDDTVESGDEDGVERYRQSAQTLEPAPVADTRTVEEPLAASSTTLDEPVTEAQQAAVPSVAADTTDSSAAPEVTRRSSAVFWALWALVVVLIGSVLGALLTKLFLRHRRAADRERVRNQRKASGLERSIRLDHGIVVKEHPAGTPLTIDASTAEMAAIRIARSKTAPAPAAADTQPIAQMRADMLEFATEAPADLTLKLESPIAALDLELPETPESAHESDVPTEIMEAVAQRDPLADSRQFLVDTDLLALAYSEENPDVAASAEPLPLDVMAELPMLPSAAPDGSHAGDDAYYHLEAEAVNPLTVHDDPQALALWELKEEEEDTLPGAAVAHASRNR